MKKFLKVICLFLSLTVLMLTALIPQTVLGNDYMSMRDITAYDLVNEMNVGVNIGNSLDSVGDSETSWGNPKVTKELILAYKNAGFNTIRLPVTWRTHIDDDGKPDTSWLNRVQVVVNWILEEDLYCILNTHHEQNWLNTGSDVDTVKGKFTTLWAAIANRFKDYGDHLLFEGYNEILKAESDWSGASATDYKNANILSQAFVDTVRATGGKNSYRTLIISTYGAIHSTYGFELPTDTVENRLAVEFHCYFPQAFCFDWGTQTTWGSSSDLRVVESYCKTFSGFVNQKIPVILGEFGAVDKDNTDARVAYAKTVATNCGKYGIKPIWWDDGTGNNKFGLVDRYSYKVIMPGIVSALLNGIQEEAGITTTTTTVPPVSSSTTVDPKPSSTTTESTTTTVSPVSSSTMISSTSVAVTTKPYIGGITGLKADFKSVDTVNISWNKVKNADGYRVYKATGNGALKYYKTFTKNKFTVTLSRGQTYKFKIVPYVTENGKTFLSSSPKTVKVSVLAKKVAGLQKSVSKTTAKISVSKVVGAQKYEIKYSTQKNFKKYRSKISSSNKFSLKGLKKNTKYFVSVRAFTVINGKKVYTSAKKINFKTK